MTQRRRSTPPPRAVGSELTEILEGARGRAGQKTGLVRRFNQFRRRTHIKAGSLAGAGISERHDGIAPEVAWSKGAVAVWFIVHKAIKEIVPWFLARDAWRDE